MTRRHIVVIGRTASASPAFSLVDLAGTSGRLDVLVRCVRAALLVSHGVRKDTVVYLVLLGGETAPRTVRIDGATVKFLRPDERSIATLLQKVLAVSIAGTGFVSVRPGISVANAGLEAVLADVGEVSGYVLREGARDVREVGMGEGGGGVVVFVGDHTGFDEESSARLDAWGAVAVGLGPVSLHAEDAVAIVGNELDRRTHAADVTAIR